MSSSSASKVPASVLLIATRQIGDVLLTTPLLRSMRLAWPAARIDVLVYRGTGGILAGNPDCNEVIESDEHPDWAGYRALLGRILRRYDLAVTTQANDRGHIYAWLAAPRRVGLVPDQRWQNRWKQHSCEKWVLLDNLNTHTVVQNLRLAEALDLPRHFEVVPPSAGEPRLPPAAKEIGEDSAPFVAVHPYPMWAYKRWTPEGWAALIAWLLEQGYRVMLTGGPAPEETRFCADLAQRMGKGVLNLAGQLSFGELAGVLSRAAAYVGPDTSVTHLAAACGIPVVALYGPSNPVKWGPWPQACTEEPSPYGMVGRPWQRHGNVLLLQGQGDCVPCREEGCERHRRSHSRCLDELTPETVIGAVRAMLPAAP